MDSKEFSQIRRYLGKTQAQIAQLLGVSSKAIQSFEQGWRNIPAYTERQLLFLLHLKGLTEPGLEPCWEKMNCDQQTRQRCPAWEFQADHLCWFLNGTVCQGRVQQDWESKMQLCRQCDFFRALFPILE